VGPALGPDDDSGSGTWVDGGGLLGGAAGCQSNNIQTKV